MPYSERVLFVDDDPLSRRAFARAMRQCGFIIDVAENGEEALDLAKHYPYAVLAADWRMPGLDGLKLVEHVRSGESDPVCVLVTGATESEIGAVDLPTLGISALIRKPWESTALAEALQGALNNYHDRRLSSELGAGETKLAGVPVLLVESDPQDALSIQTMLESVGAGHYQVSWVQSIEDAVAHVSKEVVHAVLVSLNLPDSVGVEAVRRLLHMESKAPVLAMSGAQDETLSLTAVQAGAQDYLFKNQLDRDVLNRAIQHAIERKRTEERLTHMAHHDQLTGLANRTLLTERLQQAVSRAKRQASLVGVFFLDLDRFKAVNDTLGHDAGDQLLKQVALRLTGSVRETDTVARLGGDEFAIVLEDLVSSREATLLAQRVLNSFATPFRLDAGEVVTTTSVGIALYPHNGKDVDELLKSADSAMYRAKETGRDNYQFFSEEIHARAIRQIELESSLRMATENERFVVFFQPQVDAKTHKVIGVESLVRWRDSGKLIPPAEFVPILEESGLILPVGSWVMKKTCAQLKAWNSSSELELRAAVNISARQFEDESFVRDVREALTHHGIPGSALELEITESVLMRDTQRTRQSFEELSALGVRISIDDFGTGYSSLSYLKRFPIDGLKIDGSFIENVTDSKDDAAIASAIIGLGRALGLNVTAEGVETREQLAFLKEQRCDRIQGFLVAHPADAAGTTGWLKKVLSQGGLWRVD